MPASRSVVSLLLRALGDFSLTEVVAVPLAPAERFPAGEEVAVGVTCWGMAKLGRRFE